MAVLFAPALVPGEWLESSLMLASGILAIAVGMTGVRLHGRLAVWIPLVAGIVVWIASLAGWAEPLPETATTIAGSLLLAAGMVWNARLRHQTVCGKCGCPAHSPE